MRTYENLLEPVSINKTVFPSIELEQAQNNQSGCKGNTKGLAAVMGGDWKDVLLVVFYRRVKAIY